MSFGATVYLLVVRKHNTVCILLAQLAARLRYEMKHWRRKWSWGKEFSHELLLYLDDQKTFSTALNFCLECDHALLVQKETDDVMTDSIMAAWNRASRACDRVNLWSCRRKCMHCWALLVIVMMLLSRLDDDTRKLHDEALSEKLHRIENIWMCCWSLQEWGTSDGDKERSYKVLAVRSENVSFSNETIVRFLLTSRKVYRINYTTFF